MNTMTALATIEKLKPGMFPQETYTGTAWVRLGNGWQVITTTQKVTAGMTTSVTCKVRTLN